MHAHLHAHLHGETSPVAPRCPDLGPVLCCPLLAPHNALRWTTALSDANKHYRMSYSFENSTDKFNENKRTQSKMHTFDFKKGLRGTETLNS